MTATDSEELISLAVVEQHSPNIRNVIDINRFNSLDKLLAVAAKVLRVFKGDAPEQDLRTKAMHLLVQGTQQMEMSQEYEFLKEPTGKPPTKVRSLRVFLHDRVMRCGGRFGQSRLPFQEKFPLLLPGESHLSKLIVQSVHTNLKHAGRQQTMVMTRRTYWITKLPTLTRQVVKQCVRCQKVGAKPYELPGPPDLPEERVNLKWPYEVVGLDYTGHINFRRAGETVKGYILIISCASSRHIHLQLVEDMGVKTFIRALRLHAALYGEMRLILCDNALSFRSAEHQLQEIYEHVNSREFQGHLESRGISFKFIPPRSPWWGAHYERLIGVLKSHLKRSVGRNLLSENELRVVLAEVACVVNERPLTFVGSEQGDLQPLTPNMIVYGHHLKTLPYTRLSEDDLEDQDFQLPESLHDLFSTAAMVRQEVTNRVYSEYIDILRERQSYDQKGSANPVEPKSGDVVLVHSEDPRKFWVMAVIEEVLPGPDGAIRVARIRTPTGRTMRAIKKLFPIGVNAGEQRNEAEAPNVQQRPDNNVNIVHNDSNPSRPKRQAATKARENLKKMFQHNDSDSD